MFSDETLVRAAAAARTPLISAIGHEADRPLLDDVADLRASTPTDAAKRVVPDVAEELNSVRQARARIGQRVTSMLRVEVDRLEAVRSRPALASSDWIVDSRAEELGRYVQRSRELVDRVVDRAGQQLAEQLGHLRALSPQRTLDRGYAIAQLPDGSALRDAASAPPGTTLLLTLAKGSLRATTGKVES